MGFEHLPVGCATVGDFAARIVAEIALDEWRQLEEGGLPGEISAFNRAVLLRLREHDYDDCPDALLSCDEAVDMAAMLQVFLDQHLPDNARAQRWIVLSCLALAFVIHEPLHPIDVVKAEMRVVDGKLTYYCPACEGDGTLCGYCVCQPAQ